MKVLEMIDIIEKHNMILINNKVQINNKMDSSLLEECRINKKYFMMLLKIQYKFDYFKKVLKAHSKEITDKQILYYVFMCNQDVYVEDCNADFKETTQERMQDLLKNMEKSCDRVLLR